MEEQKAKQKLGVIPINEAVLVFNSLSQLHFFLKLSNTTWSLSSLSELNILLPWFRYVSVSSCSLTAGEVAAHSTYWNGGFLVLLSGGRLESSCLKMGRASTSLEDRDR